MSGLPWRNLKDSMIPYSDLRDPFAFCGSVSGLSVREGNWGSSEIL